jgi:hypothetical protein
MPEGDGDGEPKGEREGVDDCVVAGEPAAVELGDSDGVKKAVAVGDTGEPVVGDGDSEVPAEPVAEGDSDGVATEGDGHELGLVEVGSPVVVVLAEARSSTRWPTSESSKRSHQASKASATPSPVSDPDANAWLPVVDDSTAEEGGYCEAEGTGEGGGGAEEDGENGVRVSGEAVSD